MAKRRKLDSSLSLRDGGGDLFAPRTAPPPGVEEIHASPLDEHFARLMVRLNGVPNQDLTKAARTVSAWRGAGHSCVPLSFLGNAPEEIAESLRTTSVVGRPGEWKPLILDSDHRLYLHRYWNYEADIAAAIHERCARGCRQRLPKLDQALDEVIGSDQPEQRRAAEIALTRDICVITGGPGTGKTRTVAYITSVLQRLTPSGKRLRIALAAPTGKAAARIGESLRKAFAELNTAPDFLPEPTTLHRLIGAAGDLSTARHGPHNPIPADIVVVDEASMIDLALMWRLITALLPHARLILLGDKDQLASVEAGNVFGDLCAGAADSAAEPLSGHIATLKRSYRVSPASTLSRIGQMIQAGDAGGAISALLEERQEDVELLSPTAITSLPRLLRERLIEGYRPVLECREPEAALAAFGRFRVLCATRTGVTGVEHLNQLVERTLLDRLPNHRRAAYRGQPIMIMENDYALRLFNGDIGVVWPSKSDGSLRAFFPAADGTLKQIAVARLPRHETAWAMTVHKSQGSEFDRVLLVLPETDSRVLTRELIYTAITRARSHLTICGTSEIIRTATSRPTERFSGLRDALWKGTANGGRLKPQDCS